VGAGNGIRPRVGHVDRTSSGCRRSLPACALSAHVVSPCPIPCPPSLAPIGMQLAMVLRHIGALRCRQPRSVASCPRRR
jgi:hypothetical protein